MDMMAEMGMILLHSLHYSYAIHLQQPTETRLTHSEYVHWITHLIWECNYMDTNLLEKVFQWRFKI